MKRGIWLHQFNAIAEQTPAEIASTLVPRGITSLYVKAMDGPYWMADVYSHPMAPRNLEHWANLVEAFAAVGLSLLPWVVNRKSASEAASHIACGKAAGGLIIDFEYHYDWFWEGTVEEARRYFDQLRGAVAGGDWIAVAPDPRQLDRDYLIRSTIGGLSAYLPQTYWTDFQADAMEVVTDAVAYLGQYGDVRPILPHNSTPADMRNVLEWCVGRGIDGVSLWVMGPANAAELDNFAQRVQGEEDPPPVDDTERQQMQATIDGLVTTVADIADRLGDELLAEAKRTSVRKTEVRRIVAEMEAERVQAVGPRP